MAAIVRRAVTGALLAGTLMVMWSGAGWCAVGSDVKFAAPFITTELGFTPTDMSVGDFNGDGFDDLVAVYPISSGIRVLMGRGDGSFNVTSLASQQPTAVVVADVTGDGRLDIVVGARFPSRVEVYGGVGDGTFSFVSSTVAQGRPQRLAVGDLNGDGIPDIVSANGADSSISVFYGTGGGQFAAVTTLRESGTVSRVKVADLDRDGYADVIYTVGSVGYPTTHGVLGVRRGSVGGILSATSYPVPDMAGPLAVGDMNGDGVPDVVEVSLSRSDVSVFINDGHGGLSLLEDDRFTGGGEFCLADLDGNGSNDIAMLFYIFSQSTVSVQALTNDGLGHLVVGNSWITSPHTPFQVIAPCNANRDGRLDIALITSSALDVFLGNASGGLGSSITSDAGIVGTDVRMTDINHDGYPDAIVNGSTAYSTLFGGAMATFSAPVITTFSNYTYLSTVGDLDGDGQPDIVGSTNGVSRIDLYRGNVGGTWTVTGHLAATAPIVVTLADMDGDGRLDVVWANQYEVDVLLNEGGMSFSSPVSTVLGLTVLHGMAVGDMNGDGIPDLAITSNGGSVLVYWGARDGTFLRGPGTSITGVSSAITIGEGSPPLIWVGSYVDGLASDLIWSFRVEGNALVRATSLPCPSGGIRAYPGGNGWDVAVMNSERRITYLHYLPDGTCDHESEYGAGGQAEGLDWADRNGDGLPDLVTCVGRSVVTLLRLADAVTSVLVPDGHVVSDLGPVVIEWDTPSCTACRYELWRRSLGSDWSRIHEVAGTRSDVIVTTDADVVPGRSYDYRLASADGSMHSVEVGATVRGVNFGITAVSRARDAGALNVMVATAPGSYRLDVYDLGGRRIGGRNCEGPAGGSVAVPCRGLDPGLYFVTLHQGSRQASRKFVLMQ